MKRRIIIPIILTFSFALIVNIGFSQTSEIDTTKQKEKTELKKKKKLTNDKDTTQPQNKITVNEDGVLVRKKANTKVKTQEKPKKEKVNKIEKPIEPIKED